MKKLRSPWAKFFLLAIFFGLLIMTNPVHAADAETQQTTAEQDYDRGYDDGYQAYEDGFYGMPKDAEESEAYEDGFADGQQQAEDDKVDRKELGEDEGEKEF